MTRPSRLVRVEWSVCRHPDRPNDRMEQSRNFTSRVHAGDQVLGIARMAPKYAELIGVWETTGGAGSLEWEPVDPASLPHSDGAEARDRTMRRHSTPLIEMMTGGDE